MRRIAGLFSLSVLLIAALGGRALTEDLESANHLLKYCKAFAESHSNSGDAFFKGVCAGRLTAVFYLARSYESICPPPGVTDSRIARVAVAFIEKRPGRMGENVIELALEAYKETWPCTGTK